MSDGYSRDWEAAADQFVMDVLTSSGRERTQLRRLLSLLDDNLDPEWLPLRYTDHPTAGERLARMRSKDSRDSFPQAPDAGYADRAASVLADAVPLAIDARRYRAAVAAAERLNNPFLPGEAYRGDGRRRGAAPRGHPRPERGIGGKPSKGGRLLSKGDRTRLGFREAVPRLGNALPG